MPQIVIVDGNLPKPLQQVNSRQTANSFREYAAPYSFRTNQSDMIERLDGVDDAEQFKITLNAMSILGFTEEEIKLACKVILEAI